MSPSACPWGAVWARSSPQPESQSSRMRRTVSWRLTDVKWDVWCCVQSVRAGLPNRTLKVDCFVALRETFFTLLSRLFFLLTPSGKECTPTLIFVPKAVYWFLSELSLSLFLMIWTSSFDCRGHTNVGGGGGGSRQTTVIMMMCFRKYVFSVEKRQSVEASFLPAVPLSPISRLQTGGAIASPYLPDAS